MVAGLQFPKLISLEETINCRTEEARSIATFVVNGLKVPIPALTVSVDCKREPKMMLDRAGKMSN